MALSIKINGADYTYFISASVAASITAVARGFSFVSSADENNSFPVKIGDRVVISADGIQVIDGYIESLEISYDSGSHEIRVGGRSYLADLIDSTVPTQFEINGTTLEDIAKSLMDAIGIDANVINQAGTIRNFGDEVSSGEIGQNALEFLESYSRKRQVLLTSLGDDNLVLARTGNTFAPIALKNVKGGKDNNILRSDLSIDYSKRYYNYLVKAQLNTSILGLIDPPKSVSDQQNEVFDDDIRKSRKLELNSEESTDSFSAYDRAKWEKNIRIGKAFSYSVSVVGHTVNGELWLPNTLVRVKDDFCQLDNDTLLIKDVEYQYDVYGGSITNLTMVKKKAFTLELEQSEREANAQDTADEFII